MEQLALTVSEACTAARVGKTILSIRRLRAERLARGQAWSPDACAAR